ncbi:MAG: hypothetical protein U1E78_05130 [Gammaproteobacteria bacterium]
MRTDFLRIGIHFFLSLSLSVSVNGCDSAIYSLDIQNRNQNPIIIKEIRVNHEVISNKSIKLPPYEPKFTILSNLRKLHGSYYQKLSIQNPQILEVLIEKIDTIQDIELSCHLYNTAENGRLFTAMIQENNTIICDRDSSS